MKEEFKDIETINTSFFNSTNFSAFRQDIREAEKEKNNRIVEIRKSLTAFVDNVYNRPEQLLYQKYMGAERKMNPALFNVAKSFFVPPDFDEATIMFQDYLEDRDYGLMSENGNPRYVGRYVYPVQGFYGEVIGMIGYDIEFEPKYLRSNGLGFEKQLMFYGMHLIDMAYRKGYIIVQEGIVDTLWAWSIDEPAMGLCGDSLSEFVIRILERFGYFVILIPDNDDAGHAAYNNKWKKRLPKASSIRFKNYKDTDEWRKSFIELEGNDSTAERIFKGSIQEILSSASVRTPKHILL